MQAQKVSQAEFARTRGCSRQYINKLVSQGKIQKDENGKIDPVEAVKAMQANADPAHDSHRTILPEVTEDHVPDTAPAGASADGSFQASRSQREFYNARMAEMEYLRKVGELLGREDVEKQVSHLARILRNRLMDMPGKLSGRLVSLTSEREITALLEETINELLTEISQRLRSVSSEEGDDAGSV